MVFIRFSRDLQPQNIKTMAWFHFQGTEVRENGFSLKMDSWWIKSSTSTIYFELHTSACIFLYDWSIVKVLSTIHSSVLHVLYVTSNTSGPMWLVTGLWGMAIVKHIVGTLDAPISSWFFGDSFLGLGLDWGSYWKLSAPKLPGWSIRSWGKWERWWQSW